MGLFDRLKSKNKSESVNKVAEELPYDIKYTLTKKGDLQVDFYDKNANIKNFYDTTRLITAREPMNIEGHQIYNCAVSWYSQGDCELLNPQTGKFENMNAQEYRGVWTEINLELLRNDEEYCKMVMTALLEKGRVEEYLERGLQETPDIPCGKYVGGIKKIDERYKKFFDAKVGIASHNSALMRERREKNREMKEQKKQKAIAAKEAEIARLQSEISEMER